MLSFWNLFSIAYGVWALLGDKLINRFLKADSTCSPRLLNVKYFTFVISELLNLKSPINIFIIFPCLVV